MKKALFIFALLFAATFAFANTVIDFERLLQMKAVETACYGTYIKPGSTPPYDYYTVSNLNRLLPSNNGQTTRAGSFTGVCMDYAVWMFNSITENKTVFERFGMRQNQYFIAVSSSNPNNGITLYKLSNRNIADVTMNGYYFKRHSHLSATPHGNNRDHAWIIIQHNDGTWYWVDPTWTDNTGRVVFGVITNNKEVYRTPIDSLSVIRRNTASSARSLSSSYSSFYLLPFYVSTTLSIGISDNTDLASIGVDVFEIKNKFGFSFDFLFRYMETYDIVNSYSYEVYDNIVFAFYFSAHHSFFSFRDNAIVFGGTLGLGYSASERMRGGSFYSSSGFSQNEFNGMINEDITSGLAFKIGAYIIYNSGWFSARGTLEYRSFGGLFAGFGIGLML